MRLDTLKDSEKSHIDLHSLTCEEAELRLIEHLEVLPKIVRAVEVTHGYSHGTALKRMIKKDFYHWRVTNKRVDLNPGVTWLLLK